MVVVAPCDAAAALLLLLLLRLPLMLPLFILLQQQIKVANPFMLLQYAVAVVVAGFADAGGCIVFPALSGQPYQNDIDVDSSTAAGRRLIRCLQELIPDHSTRNDRLLLRAPLPFLDSTPPDLLARLDRPSLSVMPPGSIAQPLSVGRANGRNR